jgi:plasmid stabilization system protein ParE
MPPRAIVLDPLAAKELPAAFRWYARRSATAAGRFQAALNHVLQRIAAGAEQGTPFRQRFRWMRLSRFPYLLYYEIRDPHPVYVYAAAHAGRRPGYWLRRTRP